MLLSQKTRQDILKGQAHHNTHQKIPARDKMPIKEQVIFEGSDYAGARKPPGLELTPNSLNMYKEWTDGFGKASMTRHKGPQNLSDIEKKANNVSPGRY